MPPEGIIVTTELYGSLLESTPRAVKSKLYDHTISSLKAFGRPTGSRGGCEPMKDEFVPGICLNRVFENCRGCDQGICGECLGYGPDITDPRDLRDVEEEYIQCYRCDGRFCGGCGEVFFKCACKKAVCRLCWEDEIVAGGNGILEGDQRSSACGDLECWANVQLGMDHGRDNGTEQQDSRGMWDVFSMSIA
jgi:hypothetical protein